MGMREARTIDSVSNSDRPPDVEDRAVPGRWGGNFIIYSANTHIAIQIARPSRLIMLLEVPGKDTNATVLALNGQLKKLTKHLRESLTWDRAIKLANHTLFTMKGERKCIFANHKVRGSATLTKTQTGLLHQHFPKERS
jgi:IS30 family transposase